MSVAILISGRGSNMRALVEAGIPVAAVVSNEASAAGLEFARARHLPTAVVAHTAYPSRAAFDDALAAEIDRFGPKLVVLAGFMRILTPAFVRRYEGRLLNIHPSLLPAFVRRYEGRELNIHPSLLPAFPGLHTHARALAAGVKIHGATVHFVTPELDHGPIVIQAAVPVRSGDDEAALAARVLVQEHRIYPEAVRWFLDGKLAIDAGLVRVSEPGARQLLFDA
jgi:phosphoribosylglycinamide formyltransferase-1